MNPRPRWMIGWILFLMVFGGAGGALAATDNWTNSAGGNWETAGNWSLNRAPHVASNDTANITAAGSYTVIVGNDAADANPSSLTMGQLTIQNSGGHPILVLNYTNASTFYISNTFRIGDATVNMNLSNGVMEVRRDNVNGVLNLSTGAILNVQAGTLHAGYYTYLGSGLGSRSEMNVSTGSVVYLSNFRIGNAGEGVININGGAVAFKSGRLGNNSTSTGRVVMTSGYLYMTNASQNIGLGGWSGDSSAGGYGQIIISNGSFYSASAAVLAIGEGPNSATPNGGTGDLQVYGGVHTNDAPIYVGGYSAAYANNTTGTVLLAGGDWTARDSWYVGNGTNSYGSFTLSNGTFRIEANNKHLLLGNLSGSKGCLNIAGGTMVLTNWGGASAPRLEVGSSSNGLGRLGVSGGLLEIQGSAGGGLVVGTNPFSTASVILEGGVVRLRRLEVGSSGVLSNRSGGFLQFMESDTVSGSGAKIVDGGTLSYQGYGALNVAGAVAKFSVVSGSGLQLDGATNVNLSGVYQLANAPGSFKRLSLTGTNTLWRSDVLEVGSGTTLEVTNAMNATVSGLVTNSGTITVVNSRVKYLGEVVLQGGYVSDPSTNVFATNVTVTSSGYLAGGPGDVFQFERNLINLSTQSNAFNLVDATVLFTNGAGTHLFETHGVSLGSNFSSIAQLSNNFGIGALYLAAGDTLRVTGGVGNALYVGALDLGGLANTNHFLLDINVYYDSTRPENLYLSGGTYVLGAGALIPFAIPEPSVIVLLLFSSLGLALARGTGRRVL